MSDPGGWAPRSRLRRRERLLGVDLARGIALIGMMSVHILPPLDRDGTVSLAYQIIAGRASALFAVLAGLSLILASRGHDGAAQGARRGVVARAALIAAVGLVIGTLGSGVAVILVHYAALFTIGTLFMGLRTRTLLFTSAVWLLVSPGVGHLLRPHLPPGPEPSPSLLSLSHPNELMTGLLFTGYYPVLQWTGYLLVGMALGRLPLHQTSTALRLLIVGALVATCSKLLSVLLLGPAGGLQQLTVPPSSAQARQELVTVLQTGLHGTTPTTSWWWLAVSAPHSGTPLDLVHTTGVAVAVIGGCLLIARVLGGGWRWAVVMPVAAAGSMTLTLYTLHVVALAVVRGDADGAGSPSVVELFIVNAVVAMLLAAAWQRTGQRGPLEAVAARISAAVRT